MRTTLTLCLLFACSLLFAACKPTTTTIPPDNSEPTSNVLGEGKLGEMKLGNNE